MSAFAAKPECPADGTALELGHHQSDDGHFECPCCDRRWHPGEVYPDV